MRVILISLLCVVVGACSSILDSPPPLEVGPQPDQTQIAAGVASAINDSHFVPPLEITDLLRSPSNYAEQWMICFRSVSPDPRHLTYTVLYGTNPYTGLAGQFVKSRYSLLNDNCEAQTYHPYVAPGTPAASPSPSPTPEAKMQHRHHA
jgi:hypothetical protein